MKKGCVPCGTIFDEPTHPDIEWKAIEAMLSAAEAEVREGSGSRVRIALKGVRAVFHCPHPREEADKGAVKSMRPFLEAAKVTPSRR